MKRNLFAALVVSLAISAPAFAAGGGGIGHAGSYGNTPVGASTVSRADVKAQIVTAYRDGSLPSLNKTSYPNLSLEGQTQAARLAAQGQGDDSITRVARGE
ncbi:DUF4148 domain-containing protein [Paraburkholderia phenazinium]|jgi:hypothetical protein|uniref:DUF4148 domain-containing protein n=1 Tax=Paraburkholderia phenazinium TaxID=60549 RepID=A0A1G8J2I7_9BURK|nr:DUF4148 domain-containing protein [Paraburkholderia phenazinium]SDI25459.1 protein of unknown function [Paraburkholderia phenazinium]